MKNIESIFEKFLKEESALEPCRQDACVLAGCRQMHEASGSSIYKDFLVQRMEHIVSGDGSISVPGQGQQPENRKMQCAGIGRELLWMYEHSGEEKYKTAADQEIAAVRELSRDLLKAGSSVCRQADTAGQNGSQGDHIGSAVDVCRQADTIGQNGSQEDHIGSAVDVDSEADAPGHAVEYGGESSVWLSGRLLYLTLPFYMEYETKYHGKAEYKTIVQLLSMAAVAGQNPAADENTGWYLLALADVIGCMSMEIYEHYRFLEENLKQKARRLILDRDSLPKGGENDFGIMLGTAVCKACSQKNLNPEKYADAGLWLVRERMKAFDFVKRKETVGLLMMAYAQLLQLGGGHGSA